jgi:hypothetical protein
MPCALLISELCSFRKGWSGFCVLTPLLRSPAFRLSKWESRRGEPEEVGDDFPERCCVPFDRGSVRADAEHTVKKGTDGNFEISAAGAD